jgi:hypothetical protein
MFVQGVEEIWKDGRVVEGLKRRGRVEGRRGVEELKVEEAWKSGRSKRRGRVEGRRGMEEVLKVEETGERGKWRCDVMLKA